MLECTVGFFLSGKVEGHLGISDSLERLRDPISTPELKALRLELEGEVLGFTVTAS